MIDGRPRYCPDFCPNALRSLLIGAYIHEDVSTAVLKKNTSLHVVLLLMRLSYAHGQGHNLYHNANICH